MSKNTIILLATAVFLISCGLDSDRIKAEQERDALAKELEEIKYGAPSLLSDAKKFFQAGDIESAKVKIQELNARHFDRPEAAEGQLILKEIEEYELWNNALSTEELYATKTYINKYPNGKYITEAVARLKELKIANEAKAFQNAQAFNSPRVWKQFLDDYPNHPQTSSIREKIIDLEVDEIFGDRATGRLPSFDRIGGGYSSTSSISIENDTGCELTVRYSGPDKRIIEIPIGETKRISLSSGSYRIAASACGANYAGTEQLFGNYSSSYYISRTRY
jgi:hypothetical protein